jgi:hypothetical protein
MTLPSGVPSGECVLMTLSRGDHQLGGGAMAVTFVRAWFSTGCGLRAAVTVGLPSRSSGGVVVVVVVRRYEMSNQKNGLGHADGGTSLVSA